MVRVQVVLQVPPLALSLGGLVSRLGEVIQLLPVQFPNLIQFNLKVILRDASALLLEEALVCLVLDVNHGLLKPGVEIDFEEPLGLWDQAWQVLPVKTDNDQALHDCLQCYANFVKHLVPPARWVVRVFILLGTSELPPSFRKEEYVTVWRRVL